MVGEDRGLRQEQKEVDGFELEKAEQRRRDNDLVEHDEEQLYDLDGLPEYHRDEQRQATVVGAMEKIFEGEHIVIDELQLDQRELRALEALKTAVEGRDQQINAFVFAEDRRTLLEQALAVLQPDLAALERLSGKAYLGLVRHVGELRDELGDLEDAQAELEPRQETAAKGEAPDTEDKPKPQDDTSLTGPERKIEKPASSLTGPERKEEPRPPTTLGDPKEIAAAAKPWWRRS